MGRSDKVMLFGAAAKAFMRASADMPVWDETDELERAAVAVHLAIQKGDLAAAVEILRLLKSPGGAPHDPSR